MHRNATPRRVAQGGSRHGFLAASGLVAGGFALLLGSSTAVAQADWANWDAVAQCESGGNWHADTGNGFYGGLQFKESTWRQYGGQGSPADASRDEQIAVANRVLDGQGPSAWPKCGPTNMPVPVIMSWVKDPVRQLVTALKNSVPH